MVHGRFSKSIGLSDPTQAELKGILEACVLLLSSQWEDSHKLMVESDNQLSVNWIKNPSSVPAYFASIVDRCHNIITSRDWQLSFTYQEANGEAHKLAKLGIDRVGDLVEMNLC
ncbi:hypothetical protein V6N11_039306 [Hibiscus sabdariffa]|uniref:RNase H type-1 domain-containing protein n=1 Tax=Hibiscus sabdariffa TaxID=183260 RepID=A0ABR2SNF6_9ROSI